MSATTPKFGLPYPSLSDIPSGPVAVGNLATAIDSLGAIGGKRLVTSPSGNISSIETIVIDTQTLSLPANSVFLIEFDLCFTVSVAPTDIDMKIRLTSVSGTIIAEAFAPGTYVSPEPCHGRLAVLYKTTTAELDYFAGSVVKQGSGTGNINAIIPTSLTVRNLGPSSIIGDY